MCSCYPGYLFDSVTNTCIQGKISINEYGEQIVLKITRLQLNFDNVYEMFFIYLFLLYFYI